MKGTVLIALLMALSLLAGCNRRGQAKGNDEPSGSRTASQELHTTHTSSGVEAGLADAALARAQADNKYLVAYFYGTGAKPRQLDKLVEKSAAKWKGKAEVVGILATDPEAREITRRCGVTRVPYTTMIAPNGAVTARIPGMAAPDALAGGFVSPKTAELLRIMQADGITFLCLVNDNTKYGPQVIQTVEAAVARLGGIAEWVRVDPADPQETALLAQIDIDQHLDTATTLVISPAGVIVEKLAGKITERELFDSFAKIMASNGGCGAQTATGGSACDPGAGVGSGKGCQ